MLSGKGWNRLLGMQACSIGRLQHPPRKPHNGNNPPIRRHTQTTRRRKRNMPLNQKPKPDMPPENAEHPTTHPTTLRPNARRLQNQIRHNNNQTLTPPSNVNNLTRIFRPRFAYHLLSVFSTVLPSGTTHNGKTTSHHAWMTMGTPAGEPSPSTEPTEPSEPIQSSVDITQPMPPPPPSDSPQTFRCQKCGATFADEGSAAARIQTCKAAEDTASEDEDQQKPIPQPS